MIKSFIIAGAMFAASAGFAAAQEPQPINSFGIVESYEATSVAIKTDAGAVETYALAPKVLYLQNQTITLADIKPNDFIASAAVRKEDGKLHSTELRIFPEAMRGVGEGQRPMNDPRNQIMTNAEVSGAAVTNGSNHIKVKLATGTDTELVLDPGVPVIRIAAVEGSLVKKGAKVRLQGTRTGSNAVVNRITLQ